MHKTIKSLLGNLIYTTLVVPSFVFFLVADSKNQFAALFIGLFTWPWSLLVAMLLGAIGIDAPNSLLIRSLILFLFVVLNEIIIYKISTARGRRTHAATLEQDNAGR
jgi:hypothetical protein